MFVSCGGARMRKYPATVRRYRRRGMPSEWAEPSGPDTAVLSAPFNARGLDNSSVPAPLSLQRPPDGGSSRRVARRVKCSSLGSNDPLPSCYESFLSCLIRLPIQRSKTSNAATRRRGMAAAVGPPPGWRRARGRRRRAAEAAPARRLRPRDPEGIRRFVGGAEAVRRTRRAPASPGAPHPGSAAPAVAVDADAGELAPGPFPVTPTRRARRAVGDRSSLLVPVVRRRGARGRRRHPR